MYHSINGDYGSRWWGTVPNSILLQQFENVVNPILNRPKPKVEPPKVPEAAAKTEQPAGDAPTEPAEMEMD